MAAAIQLLAQAAIAPNHNGTLQLRVCVGGRAAFINCLGRWIVPVAVADAIVAYIWSGLTTDCREGNFSSVVEEIFRALTGYLLLGSTSPSVKKIISSIRTTPGSEF
ncbi:hypothetical protein [Synechococcus sp. UW179A]|uniref:hypothetical protein n=1 Tax=Synechococcus sp. UW179A TaxID=2575510 RepID=UPI0010BF4AC8|nr:hypothetical protein [Synechococcus sp. UW179A]